MSLREDFLAFDDSLAARGVPPLTAWWRAGIGDWLDAYERDHVLELWACVGRGAAKSTALYKLALFFTLFGEFGIPVGEIHYAIVLSRIKEEASKGLAIISRWCALLEIPHRLAGDVIELADMPRGIRVVAASVAATSGWRAFFVGKDERSKWPASGIEDGDAEEIDTSAAAMTATHRNAPAPTFGSAWVASGSFYEAITGGSNESRIVLGPAATWVAAPHISEESTRRKEKDPRRWAREYACSFQGSALSAFDLEDVDAAFRPLDRLVALGPPVLVLDPSSGRGDTWCWALASYAVQECDPTDIYVWENWTDPRTGKPARRRLCDAYGDPLRNPDFQTTGEPMLVIRRIAGLEGTFSQSITAASVVANLATHAKAAGAFTVASDQHESYLLEAAFASHGMKFERYATTHQAKNEAYLHLVRLFRERRISINPHAKMREELIAAEERIMPSGITRWGGSRSHDYASLAVVAALHDLAGGFHGSPTQVRRGVREAGPGEYETSIGMRLAIGGPP